jgi:predicted aspartyl protease
VPEDDDVTEQVCISLKALTRVPAGDTIRLRVKIQGEELTTLVDSGSTHSFINLGIAHRLGLDITHRPGLVVNVANGQQLHSPGKCATTTLAI